MIPRDTGTNKRMVFYGVRAIAEHQNGTSERDSSCRTANGKACVPRRVAQMTSGTLNTPEKPYDICSDTNHRNVKGVYRDTHRWKTTIKLVTPTRHG